MAGETGRPSGAPDKSGPSAGGARKSRGSWWRYLPLLILAVATAVAFASGAARHLSSEAVVAHRAYLQEEVVAAHPWGAGFGFAVIYVLAVALSLPGAALLTVTGGFLFGWAAGSAVAVAAATLGAVLVFLAARNSVGDLVRQRVGARLDRFAAGFRDGAFSYLLFLRLVPVFPFWLVNLAPALFGVSLPIFASATLIGIVPGTIAFAVAGSGLDEIIAGQAAERQACLAAGLSDCRIELGLTTLLTPGALTMLVALAVLSLVPILLKRVWKPA